MSIYSVYSFDDQLDLSEKSYADSSFFRTPFNTYPTIEEQKKMAHKIASILEGGNPKHKGSSEFEQLRQRAEKYSIESDSNAFNNNPTNNTYRPLRPLQANDSFYSTLSTSYDTTSDVPNCIKHSLAEAQYINPLRYVGAPEEFKQIHMQVKYIYMISSDSCYVQCFVKY
jgi:hypothetical protein